MAILNRFSGKTCLRRWDLSHLEEAEKVSYAYICRKKIPGACFDIPEIYLLLPDFPLH